MASSSGGALIADSSRRWKGKPMSTSVRHARRVLAYIPCHYCGGKATTFDHIVPRALNGPNRAWNRIPSCQPCNQAKSDSYPTCMCDICNNARGLSFLEVQPVKYEKNPELVAISKAAQHTDFQYPRHEFQTSVRDKLRREKVLRKRGFEKLVTEEAL